MSPDVVASFTLETGCLNSPVAVVAGVMQEWKGVGQVEVHKAYEIFLPKDVYETREAYR